MERIGSGIRLMIQEMRSLGRPDPEFREQHEVVVIFRNGQPAVQLEQGPLSARQMIGLQLVHEKGSVSMQDYCAATGAPTRTAQHDLRDLVDRGILTTRGKTRSVRYYLR